VATGQSGFSAVSRDPGLAARFNQALSELSRRDATAIADAYDFSAVASLVDLGGGLGDLLATLLRRHQGMRGTLVELPHAVDLARAHLDELGVGDRCEVVAGDFFDAVPSGADAYVLKSVLHDWNDERAAAILRNCRTAMSASARLLVVEMALPEHFEVQGQHQNLAREDLSMMLLHGARERTMAEWRSLLEAAGLRVTRGISTHGRFTLIEAVAAERRP
jgi:hypothetical protein